ncbi:MAG: peptidoglycan editing factor PgeF [Cytophagaceae bacterium]|nr:peptidoglycan editing factor PgeF [Cytophagaceae bacterium]MDW8456521.1 peptidoglycan editing factor PgeF [Cytophagaceae bacterium]
MSLLQFESFSLQKNILHFVTTKHGGVSKGNYESLNLSYSVEDDPDLVTQNRKILAYSIGLSADRLKIPQQTHSSNIAVVTEKNIYHEFDNTDALITSVRNCCIAVLCADCAPILLYDRHNHVSAVVHAGWRGTVKRIVQAVIAEMQDKFNTRPEYLCAAIGPCISQAAYETGPEVAEQFMSLYGENTPIVQVNKTTGKFHVDIALANREQLMKSGVSETHIELSNICTYSNHDKFFSARKCKPTGRLAAGIILI